MAQSSKTTGQTAQKLKILHDRNSSTSSSKVDKELDPHLADAFLYADVQRSSVRDGLGWSETEVAVQRDRGSFHRAGGVIHRRTPEKTRSCKLEE